jgi:hypothetical protein
VSGSDIVFVSLVVALGVALAMAVVRTAGWTRNAIAILLLVSATLAWKLRSDGQRAVAELRARSDRYCNDVEGVLAVAGEFLREKPDHDMATGVVVLPSREWIRAATRLCIGKDHGCDAQIADALAARTGGEATPSLHALAEAFRARTSCGSSE